MKPFEMCSNLLQNYQYMGNFKEMTRHYLPVTAKMCPKAARWISFVVALLVQIASASSVFSVFAWQNAMRAILNQTETESNVMTSLGVVGFALAFPAGLMYDRFGNQVVTVVAEALVIIALIPLCVATGSTEWRHYFAANLWLVDIFYLLAGISTTFMAMAVVFPNLFNFHARHRGFLVGLLESSFNAGPAVFSAIYNFGFTNGFTKIGEEGLQNLSGYFFTVLITCTVLNVAALFLVGQTEKSNGPGGNGDGTSGNDSDDDQLIEVSEVKPILGSSSNSASSSSIMNKNNNNKDEPPATEKAIVVDKSTPPNEYADFPFEEFPISKVVCRCNFWLVVVQLAINVGVQETWRNNLQTYLRSFKLVNYDLMFSVLITVIIAVSGIIGGYLSDQIANRGHPRTYVLLAPCALQALFLFISMFTGESLSVLVMTCISVSVAMGFTWSPPLVLLSEMFGSKYVGASWGLIFLASALFIFPLSIGFSSMYQAAITVPGETYCFGLKCFKWSFLMLSTVSLLNIILIIMLTYNMKRNARTRRAAIAEAEAAAEAAKQKRQSRSARFSIIPKLK